MTNQIGVSLVLLNSGRFSEGLSEMFLFYNHDLKYCIRLAENEVHTMIIMLCLQTGNLFNVSKHNGNGIIGFLTLIW